MVNKYHAHDPISDLLSDDYHMLQIMSRFNIALGVGNQTVQSACMASGVDTLTFLAVVNWVKGGEKEKLQDLVSQVNVRQLLEYLKRSHSYFIDFKLPSIRRKLIEALDSKRNQISLLVMRFYDEYAAEVSRHMQYENQYVHPFVEQLLAGKIPSEDSFDTIVSAHQDNHDNIEKSSTELKSIIIRYYPSESNSHLLNEVLMDIYMMEEDLLSHCHLEDTLFAESVRQLEKDVRDRAINQIDEHEEEAEQDSTDCLSDRERQVIIELVKGLSNKEIAENMFISVNTVMTHRRNISRKLNIHSPAGLTIYAIVNGLVKLDEVKI